MIEDDFNFTPNLEATEALKKTCDMWLAKHAPDGAYKTISVEFNNETQKYDIHIEHNPKQKKVHITNIIKE